MWPRELERDKEPVDNEQLRLWRLFIVGRSVTTGVFWLVLFAVIGPVPPLPLQPLFLLATIQFSANGLYIYLWRRRDIAFLGYLSFSLEILLTTLLIYALGTDGYAFVLAYLWPIIMGGWLIGRGAILPLTLLSGLGYSFVALLGRQGLASMPRVVTPAGTSLALVLSLPYLAFPSLLVWLLTREMERGKAQLQHERNLLRSILANMTEGILVADMNGKVLLANRAAANLLRIHDAESLPGWFTEHMVADPGADPSQEVRRVIDFEGKIISTSMATLPASGEMPASTIYAAHNITQEAQAERMKSDFVAYVSHELRTPLTTIKMLLRLLFMDAARDSKQHEYLTVINTQVERQARLVSNLLDFTKLEAGKYELPLENVVPRTVLQSALSICRPLAEAKGIKIIASCDGAPDSFVSNGGGLEQVLINFLSNAVKFTETGGQVTVSCGCESGDVLFAVEDTGIGMTPEQMKNIFTKFYTVRNPRKHGEGTGLGLVISDMIVQELGGRIQVSSTPNVGSRFVVRLPLGRKEQAAALQSAPLERPTGTAPAYTSRVSVPRDPSMS